jgi:hypothetical protein
MLFRMRKKTRSFISVIALGLLFPSVPRAQQTAAVAAVIQVTDQSGAAVARAQVRVVPAPQAASKLESDDQGKLALQLKPGGYAIFVRVPGFKNAVAHLDVVNADLPQSGAAQLKPAQTFKIVLEVGGTAGSGPVITDSPPMSGKDRLLVLAYPYHDPTAFSLADLKSMPHITAIFHNTHTNADETYSGVRLSDLLSKVGAPIGSELHGEALTNFVVATGADGYQAILALAEVDPSFHPGEVLVADTMNGKPVDGHSGPLKLVVTEDKRPARSVRNLTTIELKLIP